MKQNNQSNFYENLANEELVTVLLHILQEFSVRTNLQDYLAEESYDIDFDEYSRSYDNETFNGVIDDLKKYLSDNQYNIKENKESKI